MQTPMDKPFRHPAQRKQHPFRRAVLRGLGVVLPPLLTVVIFLWVGSTVDQKVLQPVTTLARNVIAWSVADIRDELPASAERIGSMTFSVNGRKYRQVLEGQNEVKYLPETVYNRVYRGRGTEQMPNTAEAIYHRYVELQYLQPYITVPVALTLFICAMYLLGKFMAAGIGRVFWNLFERGIHRLPLVRNVYSSVKQVTDFMFNESEIEYTRVVAVQYPRKGIWSLGFVTGESMLDIRNAAGEAVLSVLIPSSPMPVTGYTITVLKSETIDLNITLDQAFQFTISCGVVVPPQQMQAMFSGTPELTADEQTSQEALSGAHRDPE